MDELKTLKDMKVCSGCAGEGFLNCGDNSDYCDKIELKQEAIKWIKNINKLIDDNPMRTTIVAEGQIFIFTAFFNMTEEDLE